MFTTAHLLDCGLSSSAISRWVDAGKLHVRYRGVYTLGHAALSREGELLAAVYACGEGALLSHLSAAELRELRRRRRRRDTLIDVLVPRQRLAPPGIRIHRTRAIHPQDVDEFKGVPVTTVPRMLVDLSDVQHPLDLANLIHEAAFWRRFDERATRDAMARANGRHHLDRLERALAYHAGGSAGFKSRNEARCFALIERAGLTEPLVNVDFHGLEVDFRSPDARLAVEIDGSGHERPRSKREDAATDLALRATGYTVLRFTDADLEYRPEWVTASLRRTLRSR